MNINDAEKFIPELTEKETEAYDFGFDGGGKTYIYSLEIKPILAFVTKRDSKEILILIAINQRLKTSNGVTPKSNVKEIL